MRMEVKVLCKRVCDTLSHAMLVRKMKNVREKVNAREKVTCEVFCTHPPSFTVDRHLL